MLVHDWKIPGVLFVALGLGVFACGSSLIPERDPTIEGSIVALDVQWGSVQPPSIHVKADPSDPCGIYLGIGDGRLLRERPDGAPTIIEASDLQVGARVKVWARGNVILESCPEQASAATVLLLD